jgi:hypothetical protein
MRDRNAARADIASPDSGQVARDRATVRSVGSELDALALRLRRLGEAGILTEQQRETLQKLPTSSRRSIAGCTQDRGGSMSRSRHSRKLPSALTTWPRTIRNARTVLPWQSWLSGSP